MLIPCKTVGVQEPELSLKRIAASSLSDIAKHSPEHAQAVVDAGAVAFLAPLVVNQDAKVKRQVHVLCDPQCFEIISCCSFCIVVLLRLRLLVHFDRLSATDGDLDLPCPHYLVRVLMCVRFAIRVHCAGMHSSRAGGQALSRSC